MTFWKKMTEENEMEKNRPKLTELNDQLTCRICSGYLIDATTITDCIHSFCRVCLARHLKSNPSSCPICGRPVYLDRSGRSKGNVRSDPVLQDLVYKLVPQLFAEERMRRRLFLLSPRRTENQQSGLLSPGRTSKLVSLAKISLVLARTVCIQSDTDSRQQLECTNDIVYLQCSANMTISVLKKFIRCKMDLENNNDYEIWIYHRDLFLKDYYTLLDVAEIYDWNMMSPLNLFFMVRQSTETFSSVADVLLRSSISAQLNQSKERLHVNIDLATVPRNRPPAKAIRPLKKRQQRDVVVVSCQSPGGNDKASFPSSLHKGRGDRLPVLQTTQRSRSGTSRGWEPDDSGFLSSTNLDHLLSTPSSAISSCPDAGGGRHVCENRVRTKTLSKKEMFLSKLRSQTVLGTSSSSPGHLISESHSKHSDCTPVVANDPSLPGSSSLHFSQVSATHRSGTTPLINRFVQTPDEKSGLPLKKRMFFGDHGRSSLNRSGRENTNSSIVGSLITDPQVPSVTSSVIALPLRNDSMSSSSPSAGVSGVPLQIYQDETEANSSSPPAKIGIIICRGRAMTLQDRQKMLAKCSSPSESSAGSFVVRPSASGSSTGRETPIDPCQWHSESENMDAETRNFWWKKRSQMQTQSMTFSESDTLKHRDGKRCAIENNSDSPKMETAKRRHRSVLRVRGNTPVNHTTMNT